MLHAFLLGEFQDFEDVLTVNREGRHVFCEHAEHFEVRVLSLEGRPLRHVVVDLLLVLLQQLLLLLSVLLVVILGPRNQLDGHLLREGKGLGMRGVDFVIGLAELPAGLNDNLLKDLVELMVIEDAIRIDIYKDERRLALALEASEVIDRVVDESCEDAWEVDCVLLQRSDQS